MLTSRAYWRRALAEGVAYHLGDPISGIERVGDMWQVRSGDRTFEAPILINCAGAWGDQIAGHLGEEAPLTPKALTMMVTSNGFPISSIRFAALPPAVCRSSSPPKGHW